MTKQPFTYATLLSVMPPAAQIAVYEDGQFGFDTIYEGAAIKSRDVPELMAATVEVRHIGAGERNPKCKFEIFVDGVAAVDVQRARRQQ